MKTEAAKGHAAAEGRPGGANPWAAPVFFLLLAVISVLLHFEKSRWQRQALEARQQLDAIAGAGPIEEIKAQRSRFYKIQYYLGYPSITSNAVVNFVRRLNTTIPLQHVRDLQIEPGLQDLSFRVTVMILAGKAENAWLAASAFCEEMRNFPEITQISLAWMSPLSGAAGGDRLHFFSVTGQAEMR